MLQARAPSKQSPPAIPASVGEVVSMRQAKNAITAPVIPPPMIFDDEDGIYKFRDIYFSRIIMPGDNGPPDFKSLQVQQINKLEENEVIEKKRNWLIETKLLKEMLSDDPCERTIKELHSTLGAGYESPYLPVPKPDGN